MGIFARRNTSTPSSTTPVTADTVAEHAPDLVSLVKTAGVSLTKRGLGSERAAVYLVLDHSGSMQWYYDQGTVQNLAEQALGLAVNLDDDGTVPVVFFNDTAYKPQDARIGAHHGIIDALRRSGNVKWGGTRYAPAMRRVIDAHRGQATPAFVIFQTDGACSDQDETAELLHESAAMPIFWQFVGFGSQDSIEFTFLRTLNQLRGRVVDNAGFCAAGPDPRQLTDADLYDRLLDEYPQWLAAARTAGIVQ
ncbi:VWA domain-containing protein [Kitasatospora atroaurantiaca]|uniref:TerF-like vWA domain-containing protein n=1 Tax=Kitasatospora atroaurantiaca TaxID=285545 RepID=A0A561EN41_9ACTN|nr:VWA domain-containing protein [Kitasatospora atroaurantiaca]TWE17036.1 TerF-like vWA domain-containing protein [Kitasatospora atroaurantiaca]